MKKFVSGIIATGTLVGVLIMADPNAPPPVGNRAFLTWQASASADGVTNYYVYATPTISSKGFVRVAATLNTNVAIDSLGLGSGTYVFFVTAANVNGESVPSSNLVGRYHSNKPNPPQNVIILQ